MNNEWKLISNNLSTKDTRSQYWQCSFMFHNLKITYIYVGSYQNLKWSPEWKLISFLIFAFIDFIYFTEYEAKDKFVYCNRYKQLFLSNINMYFSFIFDKNVQIIIEQDQHWFLKFIY